MTASSAPLLLPRAPAPAARDEVRRQVGLAAPLVACSLLQYNLQVVSVMFVGHLGELPLSAASVAASFANVTGFSVLDLSIREFSSHQLNANLLWPGTFFFADWLVKNPSILDGQRILELGSGTGALAIFLQKTFGVDITTSDYDDKDIEENIAHNCRVNNLDVLPHIRHTWGDPFPILRPDWNIVIASDILLYVKQYPNLITTLSFLLKESDLNGQKGVCTNITTKAGTQVAASHQEVSPQTKHQAKRHWNKPPTCGGGYSELRYSATDAKHDLFSWAESQSLHCWSAKYCPLMPPSRSTIAVAFSLDGRTLASTQADFISYRYIMQTLAKSRISQPLVWAEGQ
ncbi:hypothetical protein ZWY2020_036009 [Hordeum vulgare]|nr:hypothetical protein ZWY2020_036009 [Hordeum vulgare]